jgi:hypothetical protein
VAEGDLERAVRTCVKAQLKAKGFNEPYDLEGTMGGAYGYSPPLMILFHKEVQNCLKPHFKYQYDRTNDYIAKTVAMKLRDIYVEIEFRTSGPDLAAITASDTELTATASFTGIGPGPRRAAKKQANKPPKAAAKTPAKKPARKNLKKAPPVAKKAKGKPKTKSRKR